MSETELKFEVSPQDLERLSRHPALAAEGQPSHLSSIYYDTDAGDLRKKALSLRVRHNGKGCVQTLKRTRCSDLFDRDEWEFPSASSDVDPQLFAQTPLSDILARHHRELEPKFVVQVDRTDRPFTDGDAEIEISVDRGEIVAGQAREPILELELELKSGPTESLYELADSLIQTAPIRLSFDTKSDRGYRLVSGKLGDARKAEALGLSPNMTTASAFGCVARACLVQLAGNANALQRARKPEALHQARIALRRLRSALVTFKPILLDDTLPWVRGELKWVSDELNAARDLDVFLERATSLAGRNPDWAAYLERLEEAQTRAYSRAMLALDSERFAKLLLRTALWVEAGAWSADPARSGVRGEPVAAFASRVLDQRRRKLRKLGKRLEDLNPETRHDLRIEAKKLRYAAEFFEGAFPDVRRRRRRFMSALKALQEELGALNDIAVSRQVAREGVNGRGAVDLAFAAGEVVGRLAGDETKLMRRAAEAYADFRHARPFWTAPEAPEGLPPSGGD